MAIAATSRLATAECGQCIQMTDPLHDHELSSGHPSEESSADLPEPVDVSEDLQQRRALGAAISLDGLWEWDLRTDELAYSDRCRELLGYASGEIPRSIGFFWDSLHPEDADGVRSVLRRHLEVEASERVDAEYRLRTKQGAYRWFGARGQVHRDASGRPTSVVVILQDIDDRKRIERTLDERLRFERLLAELLTTFINLDPGQIDGAIDASLRKLVETLGHDRASVGQFVDDSKQQALVTHSFTVDHHLPFAVGSIVDDGLSWFVAQLRLGRMVFFRCLPDDLPPEAVQEKEYCVSQGIKSTLTIPLKAGEEVLGALMFAFLRDTVSGTRKTSIV